MSKLIDTSVFISALRGYQPAIEYLSDQEDFIISFVTAGELLQGAKNKSDVNHLNRILEDTLINWADPTTLKVAYWLLEKNALKNGLQLLDAIVAATALEQNISLVTDNTKHFKGISGLKLEKPPYK